MSVEDSKLVIQRYAAAYNSGDSKALLAMFSEDAMIHGVMGSALVGPAFGAWDEFHRAYAMTLEIVELCVDGETVVARMIERGTSRSSFRGEEVTGKSYQIPAIEWFHIRDGKITERWGARDSLSMRRQMELPL